MLDAAKTDGSLTADAETRLAVFHERLRGAAGLAAAARWECDRAGRVTWAEGEGAPAVGAPLSDFEPGSPLATAFGRRVPFRHLEDGNCRLSAVPFYSTNGRFLGYRGTCSAGSRPAPVRSLFDTGASIDAFAHLAHEVRTPLTAIMGFAQMIEDETLGAVNPDYCRKAGSIVESATRLLDAVDDLADAAQLEQGRFAVNDGSSDIAALLTRAVAALTPEAQRKGVTLTLATAGGLSPAGVEERLLGRVLDRTLTSLLAASREETLVVGVRAADRGAEILVSRPLSLQTFSATQLLDPAQPIPLQDAPVPLLGLGFGLRLAARLLAAVGGRLVIDPGVIRLEIPGIAKLGHIA